MALSLLRKPGDPYDPLLSNYQSGIFGKGYTKTVAKAAATATAPTPTATAAPAPVAAPATPAAPAPVAAPSYTAPAQGTVGPGGAKFNGGLDSGVNPYDYKSGSGASFGAGLYAAGYDVKSPDILNQVKAYTASAGKDYSSRIEGYYKNNPADRGNDAGTIKAADWYSRDLTRREAQDHSFLNSTFGKVLVLGAEVAASFIPGIGPAVAAGIGATTGGIQGGIGGAVLGGIQGYGVGAGTQFAVNTAKSIAQNGVTSTFNTLIGKSAPIIEGTTAPITRAANGVLNSVPSQGVVSSSGSYFSGIANKIGGIAANTSVSDAASAINAGLGLKNLLAGGAAATAAVAAANLTASSGTPPTASATTPPPESPIVTQPERAAKETQTVAEEQRRRVTQTVYSWDAPSLTSNVRRPTLLGGALKLAA